MKKSKLTRKLVLSCATLGVAAASVVSTTYAWFTMGNSATASGVDGTAESVSAGLLLSKDGTTFTDSLSLGLTLENLKPVMLDSATVSATAGETTIKYGTLTNGAYTVSSEGTAVKTAAPYVAFDLYLQLTNTTAVEDANVTVAATFKNKANTLGAYTLNADAGTYSSSYESILTSRGFTSITDATGVRNSGSQAQLDIIDALKMSVIDTTDASAKFNTISATGVDSGLSQETYITNVYKKMQGDGYAYPTISKTNHVSVTPTYSNNDTTATTSDLFKANATAKHYVVVIWLDGTDEDCFDPLSAQGFTVDFKFDIVSK